MNEILNFEQIRLDDHVITESMTAQDMRKLGWSAEKIVLIRWTYEGHIVQLKNRFGLLGRVLADRKLIAVLEDVGADAESTVLKIYSADGSLKWQVTNVMPINGRPEEGKFLWFERPRVQAPSAIGAVFWVRRNNGMWQVDIDAAKNTILAVHETR